MHEFDLIQHFFKPLSSARLDVILGIGDDCALLQPPQGQLLAVSTDTLVENIHFLSGTKAKSLGYKSLAVSLSDLAAMGAEPAWVMLSLSLPAIDESWLAEFCQGFSQLLSSYNLQLIGGNTTRGPLAITTHISGFVPEEMALLRSGAKAGDDIYITGQPGDAALGLRCLRGEMTLPANLQQLAIQHLEYPTPQIAAGIGLRNIASSCIDVSDGLVADLGHILAASQLGATIIVDDLPLSAALTTLPMATAHELILSGGDDYELCFTANPDQRTHITQLNIPCSRIGTIESTAGIRVRYRNGQIFNLPYSGYEHFGRSKTL